MLDVASCLDWLAGFLLPIQGEIATLCAVLSAWLRALGGSQP